MNSDPTAPLTSYALGCYYLLIKNLDEAKRWFRKSFMVDGAFWRGYIGMGVAVLEEKEWDGVLRWCGGVGGTGYVSSVAVLRTRFNFTVRRM